MVWSVITVPDHSIRLVHTAPHRRAFARHERSSYITLGLSISELGIDPSFWLCLQRVRADMAKCILVKYGVEVAAKLPEPPRPVAMISELIFDDKPLLRHRNVITGESS